MESSAIAHAKFRGAVSGLQAGDPIVATLGGSEAILVDLGAVDFVDPSGMLALATACVDARLYGHSVLVRPPELSGVATYLVRMRFRDVLAKHGVRFTDTAFARRVVSDTPLPGRLLELEELGARQLDAVGERLVRLGRAVGLRLDVLQRAFLGLQETLENALQHSGQITAFAVAQRYEDRRTGSTRLEIAVGDIGVGLRETLRHRHRVTTDEDAVRLAIREGVSRFARAGRGEGLFWAVRSVARDGQGTFQLRSGSASIHIGSYSESVTAYPVSRDGVQVSLMLRTPAGG